MLQPSIRDHFLFLTKFHQRCLCVSVSFYASFFNYFSPIISSLYFSLLLCKLFSFLFFFSLLISNILLHITITSLSFDPVQLGPQTNPSSFSLHLSSSPPSSLPSLLFPSLRSLSPFPHRLYPPPLFLPFQPHLSSLLHHFQLSSPPL